MELHLSLNSKSVFFPYGIFFVRYWYMSVGERPVEDLLIHGMALTVISWGY
jgi:hypothetical protein